MGSFGNTCYKIGCPNKTCNKIGSPWNICNKVGSLELRAIK
jgi:hypothetical protein